MNKIRTFWEDTAKVWLHEMRDMFKDEGALLFVILLPLAYPLLYSWIYNNEVVREVPVAIVDNSHSQTSREFVRHVDASSDVRVAAICNNLEEASRLVGQQEVYGIILLPEDFDRQLGRMEQAHVSVYCNMGLMLTYKAIFQPCTAVAADMNAHIQQHGWLRQLYPTWGTRSDYTAGDVAWHWHYLRNKLRETSIWQTYRYVRATIRTGTNNGRQNNGIPCAIPAHCHLGAACRATTVPLRTIAARLRFCPVCIALSVGLHFLLYYVLVLCTSTRECDVACGLHVCTLPLYVGCVVA